MRRKVCQWSIGQSTRDLWKHIWSAVFYPWSSVYKAQSPASHLWQTATSHHKVSDNGPTQFCMSNHQHRAISMETDDWISCCLCQCGEDLIVTPLLLAHKTTHCCQRIRRLILSMVCESSSVVWEELHRLLHCLPTWTALISRSRREETLFYCHCVVVVFFNEHSCNPHQRHPPPPLPHDKSRLAGHVWPREDEERFVGGFGFFIRASVYLYERPGCCWAISTQRLFLNQWAVTVRWMKRFHLSWDTEHRFGQGGSVKFGCWHYKRSDKYETAI